MIKVDKWSYQITEEDEGFCWSLTYDYNNEFMVKSEFFKTFKACKKDAVKHMEKMLLQFEKIIQKAFEEKE